MGSGSFSFSAYTAHAYTRSAVSSRTAKEVFTTSNVDARFDVRNIALRESCISEEHPNPTPIILAMDDTGSMGFVSKELVAKGLGKLIQGLHESNVSSPHIMLQFVGDVKYDSAPLQATQFESDLRILEQIQCLWLECHGGGNDFESYNLPWYFALNHTKQESFEATGKKGYIFTVGDEGIPSDLTAMDILRAFGHNVQAGISNEDLLEAVSKRYNVFHVVALEGQYGIGHEAHLRREWPKLMGRRVLFMKDHREFANIALAAIRISEGEDRDDVVMSFQDTTTRKALEEAFPVV